MITLQPTIYGTVTDAALIAQAQLQQWLDALTTRQRNQLWTEFQNPHKATKLTLLAKAEIEALTGCSYAQPIVTRPCWGLAIRGTLVA